MKETILGASITLLTTVIIILLKNTIDERRENKNWFFDYYITNSLDPIISAATVYSYVIKLKIEVLSEESLFTHNISFDELVRVSSLINCSSLHVLFNLFYISVDQYKHDEYGKLSEDIEGYISKLEELRGVLISMDIKKKKDTQSISRDEKVQGLCSEFKKLVHVMSKKYDQSREEEAT